MAYAALTSLANTIDQLLNDNKNFVPLEVKPQFITVHEYVTYFQAFVENFPDKYGDLNERMRELAYETEGFIEDLLLVKVRSSSDHEANYHTLHRMYKHQDMEKVIEEIDSIAREISEIKHSFRSRGVEDGAASSSSTAPAPPIHEDAMVGFEDHEIDVKGRLCGEETKLQVIPICGMGGIGKTILAKNVYDDPLITESFDIRVWVTISQDYSKERVLSSLRKSLKEFNTGGLGRIDEDAVYKILKARRYLVVMDDIWSREAWDDVRKVFPDDGNGSRILLTTRLSEVASYPDSSSNLYEMRLMDADQSWNLFEKKVFKDEDCPPELEKIGKYIARSCKGLPLAIVVIAGLLSAVDKNLSSWQEIAENVKSAGMEEQRQIEGILSLSYVHLPQYLRPCFLYMGSFPEDREIRVSKLIKLWVAEGFLKCPDNLRSQEEVAEECLEDLVKRNLVLVTKRKCDGSRIKSCSLHDLIRDLCIRKAHESKFFLNLMNIGVEYERFIESIENHRRISVHSETVHHLSSSAASTIRTIRCSNDDDVLMNLYSVEKVRSLRVLDVEPINARSLMSLFQLFNLRYLAVRYSGSISEKLSVLQNLQTLIIHRESRLWKLDEETGVSLETEFWLWWCMPQLRHVYFHGTIKFSDPQEANCSLKNLLTVSYVSYESCSERILKNIPNLRKLKINCSTYEVGVCLNDLVHLHRLEKLEIYAICWDIHEPKYCNFTFPKMLKRLTLRDLEIPWNDMIVAGSLPNLQVLKLKNCTCAGSTWETTDGAFPVLEVLLIKSRNFKNWKTESSHFPRLKRLMLHSCVNLHEIPNDVGEIPTLELIELKGVSKSLEASAKRIQEEQQEEWGNYGLQVHHIFKKKNFKKKKVHHIVR